MAKLAKAATRKPAAKKRPPKRGQAKVAKTVRSAKPVARKAAKKPARNLHEVRFPNEGSRYRTARNKLLQAERDLRRQIERVAALRRRLPTGGPIAEDYVLDEAPIATPDAVRSVRFSELFGESPTLLAYNFMFGPDDAAACPSCTSILDALDGSFPHVTQRVPLVVIAKSPIARILAHARERGWRNLRLLSSFGNSYNRDYRGESEDGRQRPALNVFVRRDGAIHHFYNTELMFMPSESGQDPRHVDSIWPIWNLLDLTPEGRGTDWRPSLRYES
jgi:predicted dithiol-disulfide oxidoreductase (DUF899 family)